MKFSIGPTSAPLTLQADLGGFANAPSLPFQPTEVYVNGQKIADWQVAAEKSTYTAAIAPELLSKSHVLTLEFKMPKAASPKQLGQSEEPRVLGLRFYDLTINKSS